MSKGKTPKKINMLRLTKYAAMFSGGAADDRLCCGWAPGRKPDQHPVAVCAFDIPWRRLSSFGEPGLFRCVVDSVRPGRTLH